MQSFQEGLRCQDVHSGLRNVDPNSPLIASLADTRVIGMAASVAGLIRGRDVITDAQSLSVVAAHQLDVDLLAFNEVMEVLEDAGFVEGVHRRGNKIESFTENVPYYENLFHSLGQSWRERQPTELEQQVLLVVDGFRRRRFHYKISKANLVLIDRTYRSSLRSGLGPELCRFFAPLMAS